jgi:ParB family transcriptional regulator, chromosome partitioning protein
MIRALPVAAIYGNPDQPRKTFAPAELQELADSIQRNGLIQPITVRADGADRYMIVAGERRWRAHQLAGIGEIPAIVADLDDTQLAVNAIIENDQRVDVAPLEQARSYQRMIDEHGFTSETLAEKLGKPHRRITERLQLLNMSQEAQQLLSSGALTPTQAWWCSQLPERLQSRFIRGIAAGGIVSNEALKAFTDTLTSEGAQGGFALDEPEPPTAAERAVAETFEAKLDKIAAMLRASIEDNDVVAVRKVNPDRAGSIATLLNAMQIDMRRLETAFRVAAGLGGE